MIVALAGGRYENRRVLTLVPRSVDERLDFEARWPLPWTSDSETGDYLIHASGLWLAAKLRFADRYADPATRDWCRSYMAEARASYGPGRFAPSDGYDWSRHFTAAWVPKDYQRAGMEIVYRRMTLGSGNILADDVGLGKTIQAIGLIGRLVAERQITKMTPVVVVTGLSLKSQWRDEVERFSNPRLKCVAVDGPRKERLARLKRTAAIYVVNYEMVRDAQYRPDLDRLAPALVVLDETKAIANPASATSRAVVDYCSLARWSLSFNATPIENNFGDIYPQVKAADANLLGDPAAFANRYLSFGFGGRVVGFRNEREFRLRAAPVLLRRTHRDVGSEIPRVVPMARPCRMGPAQLAAYRAACGDYLGGAPTGAIAMAKVAAVRYAAFAADVGDPASDSCKCDDLELMLAGDLAGERVVVFSCFKRVVEFVARRFASYRPLVIHSGVSAKDRADARRRFNSGLGEGRLIVGTGAMARGMNLQAARVVWSLDLPWNPGAQRQRIGRIARIGQAAKSVLSIHSRAQTPSGGPTVDDWFDSVIFPRKRAAMIAGLGDDGVRELGSAAPDPTALAAFLRGLAG